MKVLRALLTPLLIGFFVLSVHPASAQYEYEDSTTEYEYSGGFEIGETTEIGSVEGNVSLEEVPIGTIIIMLLIGSAMYIFGSIALAKIGKEMGYDKPWFAWLPFLNIAMILKLGNQNPLLTLLILLPGLGAGILGVLQIIALANITEKRGYSKSLVLIVLTGIGYLVLLYLLAWKPKNTTTIPLEVPQTPIQPEQAPQLPTQEATMQQTYPAFQPSTQQTPPPTPVL